jgi:DNA-binding NarL/FixJ family response regulator
LLLSDDLLFTSRIVGAGQRRGLLVKPHRSVEGLKDLAQQHVPKCVLVDLGHPRLAIADLIGWLRETCAPMPRVVAYGSHIDAATLRAAREAGCDLVLPRSKFVEELPEKIDTWLADRDGTAGP